MLPCVPWLWEAKGPHFYRPVAFGCRTQQSAAHQIGTNIFNIASEVALSIFRAFGSYGPCPLVACRLRPALGNCLRSRVHFQMRRLSRVVLRRWFEFVVVAAHDRSKMRWLLSVYLVVVLTCFFP